ncbi:MAG: hypothetical protein IJX99_04860 [Clostridia bacterium]|nr:hypothetical protein [Clostridia bacterium]
MSNSKMYKAYHQSVNMKPVFMDGETFVELLMQKGYDEEMFKTRIEGDVRYFVPSYSFVSAMNRLSKTQRDVVNGYLVQIPVQRYSIFEDHTVKTVNDEEVRVVSSALELREKYPNMRMEVSSRRIWELFRIASVQKVKDSDLL